MYFKYNTPLLEEQTDFNLSITEDDPIYAFCEECIDLYVATDEDIFLEAIINEDLFHKAKRILRQNKGKAMVGAAALGTLANIGYTGNKMLTDLSNDYEEMDNAKTLSDEQKAAAKGLNNFVSNGLAGGARQVGLVGLGIGGIGTGTASYIRAYRNKPKSVIAKKIASLREIYAKWLQRANNAIEDREAGFAKRIAAKIMNIIDGLLELLQRKADGR